MKIAYLLNTYPAPSGTFIRNEIEALEGLGVEVLRLAVREFDGPLVDPADQSEQERTHYLLDGNLRILVGAGLRELITNPRGVLRSAPAWSQLLRNARGGLLRHVAYWMQAAHVRQVARTARITHVHSHFSNNAPAVAMLSRLLGGPSFSFTAHGPDEFVEAGHLSFPLKIAQASFVVAISEYCRQMLTELAGNEALAAKIVVARCGLDLDHFKTSLPAKPANQTLVCVGRLCPQKGQIHIPAAVAALRQQFPAIKVILVGDGESRAAVAAEIQAHQVEDRVVLHGWASGDEVRTLIGQARALLLPSYAEGLPVVIMEAFALGRPVISTAIAAIPELVDEECGWLVEPGDHAQLVAAIAAALSAEPDVLGRMGQEGRERVERQHDRQQLARILVAQFQQATART